MVACEEVLMELLLHVRGQWSLKVDFCVRGSVRHDPDEFPAHVPALKKPGTCAGKLMVGWFRGLGLSIFVPVGERDLDETWCAEGT